MSKCFPSVGLEEGLETWPALPGEGASLQWCQMDRGLEFRDRQCQLQSHRQRPACSPNLVGQVLLVFQPPTRSLRAAHACAWLLGE